MTRVIQLVEVKTSIWAVYACKGGGVKFVQVVCLGTVEGSSGVESRRLTGFVCNRALLPAEAVPGFLGLTEKQSAREWKKEAASHAREVERTVEAKARRMATEAISNRLA